ncbi:putative phosphoesterase [Talaromyces proteolyticus]|uniref:Phosphoesterase n=1 Tax=Talaromyces proteolyticus TaxID=1131652 RepID=A0AAD4Q100_9EURO|nr:putative phosphoesterase [Talaromyces proteolyticus]KAH8697743.1 putative phosphoesterase [Talaromyces proteolyticus]
MGSVELPYIRTNPKIIFFTDFDGTITLKDSNDYLTDNLGYGYDKRRQGNEDVLTGKATFRDAFRDMLDSVKPGFAECIQVLKENMKLDPYFTEFYNWAKENNVPIVVVSSGMVPIISGLFEVLLGHKPDPQHLSIVANDVESRDGKDINTPGGWQIKYHDDSHFGHDKSLAIKPYAALPAEKRPTLLYAGDGVSDLSAASETDLLFAKKGHDLVTYCERQGMPFTVFEDWSTILATTKDIYSGKVSAKKIRTGAQLSVLGFIVFLLVLFLDNQFRVLPNSIHGRLPTHHPGFVVTDVTITKCSSVNVFSSCTLDPSVWYRIDKDLYLGNTWASSAYVHFQRKKEEDLLETDKVVVDLRISRTNPGLSKDKKTSNEEWESRPGGIWLKRSAEPHVSDSKKTLTSLDVLFGIDAVDPRPQWEVKDLPILLDGMTESTEARITVRRGVPPTIKKPVPKINDNDRFKIMQAADLHLSTGTGVCRDPVPEERVPGEKCEADPRTLEFFEKLLDEEKPDLVVFSGDEVNGDTAKDAQSAVFKFVKPLVDRKIPYAAIFGNHDDEGDLNREQLMNLLEDLPYSLSSAGPEDVEGVGNYIVEVLGRSNTQHSALTLYLLDTHSYSPDERQFKGYNWLKPSQIRWFKSTAQSLKRQHDKYTHMHMNMAFIHIPLPEYRGEDRPWKGHWLEAPTAPAFNSGFMDALIEENVLFVSCGHDHVNDYCMLNRDSGDKPNLWMCYGGASGFGGYGGYDDYIRRMRFYEFDMGPGRIVTYKRLEYGDTESRLDEMMIVDAGQVRA